MSSTETKTTPGQDTGKASKGKDKKAKSKADVVGGTVVKPKRTKRKKKKASKFNSTNADLHELYQLAVQSADVDVEFLETTFENLRGRKAVHFREDFCGTALLCSHWVRLDEEKTAEGFDNDSDPLEWGREHNLAAHGESVVERVALHLGDVREPSNVSPEVRCAQNFSYCIFQKRDELLDYFRIVLEDLADDGIFVLDMHGGPESTQEVEEVKEIDDPDDEDEVAFDYIWEQHAYYPVTGQQTCSIHFEFPDGSKVKNAFTYTWRLWSMPELIDILHEAGFSKVEGYFEGDDEDPDSEEGNGVFEPHPLGENCDSWIAYLVAER